MKLQTEQMEGKPITCKQAAFVMKDASVPLDGCCPTNTAAAHHGSLHQAPHTHKPPPLLTAVQQLDPWGALLAKMPTHSTPWCQNTEHSGITETAQSKINRQTCQNHTALQSDLYLYFQKEWVIDLRQFRCQVPSLLGNVSWSYRCTYIPTFHSLPLHTSWTVKNTELLSKVDQNIYGNIEVVNSLGSIIACNLYKILVLWQAKKQY